MGRNIGKLVPTSKRMIKWGFIINMKKVEVVLKHSTVSGKRLIERTFDRVFKYWHEIANPSNDYSVQPLKYVRNAGTPNNN